MMLLLLVFLLSSLTSSRGALQGDHVCAKAEKYDITVSVSVMKPYKIKENYWCPKFPPRCTREKTLYKTEMVPEVVTKTRLVSECCKGYIQNGDTCVASCPQGCERGECIAPDICKCHPDFYGPSCEKIYELVTLSTRASPTEETKLNDLETSAKITPSSTTPSSTTTSTPSTTTIMYTVAITTQSTTTEAPAKTFLHSQSPPSTSTTPFFHHPEDFSDSPLQEAPHINSTMDEEGEVMQGQASDVSAVFSEPPSWPLKETEVQVENTHTSENSQPSTSTPSVAVEKIPIPASTAAPSTVPPTTSTTETDPFSPLQGNQGSATPTFGTSRGFTSVIVMNDSIHTFSSMPHPDHQHRTFFEENMTLLLVIAGAALSLVIGTVLTVLVCQQIIKNGKKNKQAAQPTRHMPPLPTAISLDLPPTPTINFSVGCESIDLQPAIYSMGTFKPADRQPTISQELRQALEATYDHPPSLTMSRSCRSSEGQRSLAEMWEAVMSVGKENEAQAQQSQAYEEEHLYQEIPCYHPPRQVVHDSLC